MTTKFKKGKVVREYDIKFFDTYKDAVNQTNYLEVTVEVEGNQYPPLVIHKGHKYHSRVIVRTIPTKPYQLKEIVYIRGE